MSSDPDSIPESFAALADSRRNWIDHVLRPWCRRMPLQELRKAELEWADIAGKVDPGATLWTWAWERFPVLVHEDFPGVHETHCVQVSLQNGRTITGYPDARRSQRGMLTLLERSAEGLISHGPFPIHEISSVRLSLDHPESQSGHQC